MDLSESRPNLLQQSKPIRRVLIERFAFLIEMKTIRISSNSHKTSHIRMSNRNVAQKCSHQFRSKCVASRNNRDTKIIVARPKIVECKRREATNNRDSPRVPAAQLLTLNLQIVRQ